MVDYTEEVSKQLGFCVEETKWGEQKGSSITFFDKDGNSTVSQASSNTWPNALWDLCVTQARIIAEKDDEIQELRGQGKIVKKTQKIGDDIVITDGTEGFVPNG